MRQNLMNRLLKRELIGRNSSGKTSVERQYYISNLPAKAVHLAHIVRAHWVIENCMHWVLDVAFREDDCRIRGGKAAQNFAILRRIAFNLLKSEKTNGSPKAGAQLEIREVLMVLRYVINL